MYFMVLTKQIICSHMVDQSSRCPHPVDTSASAQKCMQIAFGTWYYPADLAKLDGVHQGTD